jgi:hypothetical protein
VLVEGPRTRDIGGNASTSEVGQAIANAIDCVEPSLSIEAGMSRKGTEREGK